MEITQSFICFLPPVPHPAVFSNSAGPHTEQGCSLY
jgi:hypothetical protein